MQTLNLISSFPFLFCLLFLQCHYMNVTTHPKHTNAQIHVTSSESVGSCWKWRLHQAGHHTRVHLSLALCLSPDLSLSLRSLVHTYSNVNVHGVHLFKFLSFFFVFFARLEAPHSATLTLSNNPFLTCTLRSSSTVGDCSKAARLCG